MNTLHNVAARFPDLFAPKWTTDLTCNSGWWNIANDACEQLDALRPRDNADLRVNHISRSFGGLRLWAEPTTSEVRTVVECAESMSRYACQHCDKFGTFTGHLFGGWRTLCGDCEEREFGPGRGQR